MKFGQICLKTVDLVQTESCETWMSQRDARFPFLLSSVAEALDFWPDSQTIYLSEQFDNFKIPMYRCLNTNLIDAFWVKWQNGIRGSLILEPLVLVTQVLNELLNILDHCRVHIPDVVFI